MSFWFLFFLGHYRADLELKEFSITGLMSQAHIYIYIYNIGIRNYIYIF